MHRNTKQASLVGKYGPVVTVQETKTILTIGINELTRICSRK